MLVVFLFRFVFLIGIYYSNVKNGSDLAPVTQTDRTVQKKLFFQILRVNNGRFRLLLGLSF